MKCLAWTLALAALAACAPRDPIATDPDAMTPRDGTSGPDGSSGPDGACGVFCAMGYVRGADCTCVPADGGGTGDASDEGCRAICPLGWTVGADCRCVPPPDAATDATSSGDAGACGTVTCGAGQVCVREQVLGGALVLPDDAGMCPPGYQPGDPGTRACVRDPTYRCADRPAACAGGALSCGCAGSLCTGCTMCMGVTDSTINCLCLAP